MGFIPCSRKLFLICHIVSLQTARYDAALADTKRDLPGVMATIAP